MPTQSWPLLTFTTSVYHLPWNPGLNFCQHVWTTVLSHPVLWRGFCLIPLSLPVDSIPETRTLQSLPGLEENMFVSATEEDQVGRNFTFVRSWWVLLGIWVRVKSVFDDLGKLFNCLFVVLLNSSRCQYNMDAVMLWLEHSVLVFFFR